VTIFQRAALGDEDHRAALVMPRINSEPVKVGSGWAEGMASDCLRDPDDHRSEMILSTGSPPASRGFVNEALSIRVGGARPLCNIAVLAAGIWNPRIDGMAAASKGLLALSSTTCRSST
jgi:hypothetical protein